MVVEANCVPCQLTVVGRVAGNLEKKNIPKKEKKRKEKQKEQSKKEE